MTANRNLERRLTLTAPRVILLLALALAAWMLLPAQAARAACGDTDPRTVLCVDADATSNTPDGLSWTTAFTNVQDALAVTNANGTTDYEIWVAEGIYYPDEGAGHIDNSESEYFTLSFNNVQLYGGFAGTETLRTERDWENHLTILSGDLAQDDTDPDGDGVIITATHIITPNAYHVLYLDGRTHEPITSTMVIDGFTITAGNADDTTDPHRNGGGLYCDGSGSNSECSPSLAHVTFSGNQANQNGGGMCNEGNSGDSSPTLIDIAFVGNQAHSKGGGMHNSGPYGASNPTLTNVTFSNNQANSGGGMYNYGSYGGTSNPAMTNVIFSNNQAKYGGGMSNSGFQGTCNPVMTNVTFNGNQATSNGGGILNNGFEGISSPVMTNVTFNGNRATFNGGGICNLGRFGTSSPLLTNVIFNGNQVTWNGGGMYNNGGDSGNSHPTLINVTFSGNQASDGGGMYSEGNNGDSSPSLTNVILWGNTADSNGKQLYNSYATPVLSYTLIQSSTHDIYNIGATTVTYGTGILTTDPQFIAPIDASEAPTTTGDYRLQADSPAIDAGAPTGCPATDLDGHPRDDLRCDIGAYERVYSNGDTVIKRDVTGGEPTSFGPTWISMTLSADDTGAITVTKHLAYPGGTQDTGEMQATWYLSSTLTSGFPITLSFCYTDDEVQGLTEANLRAFRWDGAQWTTPISDSLSVKADANCVTLTGVQQFSAWTLQDVGAQGDDVPTAIRLLNLSSLTPWWHGIGGLLACLLLGVATLRCTSSPSTEPENTPSRHPADAQYEAPHVISEGELEIQAGSPLSIPSDFEDVEDWDW